jgi:hypothetical protein
MRIALLAVFCSLALAGCDPPPYSKPLDESANAQPAPEPGQELEGKQKYDPMAKAKRVEDQVMDAKEQQDKQIDEGAR